jgi:hypothetical protein
VELTMANVIYRDIACANGHEYHYAILSRLVLNGWTTVASSDGTTRTTSAPAAATDLNAANAWWVIQHTASGRKLAVKRRGDSNTWDHSVTPGGYALSTGNATTPDNNATYTKTISSNAQRYPSSATTNTKLHLVVSDSSASFCALLRRTPFVGGSTDGCSLLSFDTFSDVQWPGNPDPCVYTSTYSDSNAVGTSLLGSSPNFGWVRLGIAGEAWSGQCYLENPGTACGSTTSSPGGTDQLYEVRWCLSVLPGPLGKSGLYRGLQPYRTPITGVDSGGTLTHAAFGSVAIPNDGTALGS